MDSFPMKGADPVPSPWRYDSAIDLLAFPPADMDPVPFDVTEGLTPVDTKDLFLDPFAPSTISGLAMPTDDTVSLSSDLDSDDQSWPGVHSSIDPTPTTGPTPRWSRPESKSTGTTPRTPKPTSYSRKTRSCSQDSRRSSTSQDPQTRNAAKRAAHNIIEKRYRTNMNAKFLALEHAITPGPHQPVARTGTGTLKKSEILSNALAYIEGIQQDNRALHKELALLKQNLLPDMWRAPKPSPSTTAGTRSG
ncbi:hypothetical protein N7492_004249 [Penicillium capsulatum]|uniref:BHLH domain-containing protein n=1 Tax=Penicillium capsulatum TaxID=69766 RepID=A0A9W9LQJ7_9EURO|nr:hypothetical protein N7492_004249 [Penicillium capsulatum]